MISYKKEKKIKSSWVVCYLKEKKKKSTKATHITASSSLMLYTEGEILHWCKSVYGPQSQYSFWWHVGLMYTWQGGTAQMMQPCSYQRELPTAEEMVYHIKELIPFFLRHH